MGGYLWSNGEFDATGSEWQFEGPTVGASATYIDRALYVSSTSTTTPSPSALASAAAANVTNIGGRIDTGYKIEVGHGILIGPQGTLAYVHSDFSDVSMASGTISSEGDSLRGRLGLRGGREWRFDVM